jgi:hypothetical protein
MMGACNMDVVDLIGYFAATMVLATFCMRSMRLLRWLAIVSNFGFIAYGLLGGLWPIVVLHLLLLPINVARLVELGRTRMPPSDRAETRHGYWFRIR